MDVFENISYESAMDAFEFNYSIDFDFNETTHTLDSEYRKPKSFILYLLVFIVGLIGNATILFVVLRFRKMWTTINIYVFSLALGDLFNMLCLLFFTIEIATSYWPLGRSMCKLFWAFVSITTFSNIYILTAMTIGSFTQLYFPSFCKERVGPKYVLLTSVLVWIISLLLGMPTLIYGDLDEYNSCRVFWPNPYATWNLTFLSCRLALAFLAPLLLIAILLILMVVRAKKQEKSSEMDFGGIKETMIMIMVLCLVDAIFWLPFHVLEMVFATLSNMHINEDVYYIISLIPYLKSCVYPFLYGFLLKSFKNTFNQLFCCKNTDSGNGNDQYSAEGREEKCTI